MIRLLIALDILAVVGVAIDAIRGGDRSAFVWCPIAIGALIWAWVG